MGGGGGRCAAALCARRGAPAHHAGLCRPARARPGQACEGVGLGHIRTEWTLKSVLPWHRVAKFIIPEGALSWPALWHMPALPDVLRIVLCRRKLSMCACIAALPFSFAGLLSSRVTRALVPRRHAPCLPARPQDAGPDALPAARMRAGQPGEGQAPDLFCACAQDCPAGRMHLRPHIIPCCADARRTAWRRAGA